MATLLRSHQPTGNTGRAVLHLVLEFRKGFGARCTELAISNKSSIRSQLVRPNNAVGVTSTHRLIDSEL